MIDDLKIPPEARGDGDVSAVKCCGWKGVSRIVPRGAYCCNCNAQVAASGHANSMLATRPPSSRSSTLTLAPSSRTLATSQTTWGTRSHRCLAQRHYRRRRRLSLQGLHRRRLQGRRRRRSLQQYWSLQGRLRRSLQQRWSLQMPRRLQGHRSLQLCRPWMKRRRRRRHRRLLQQSRRRLKRCRRCRLGGERCAVPLRCWRAGPSTAAARSTATHPLLHCLNIKDLALVNHLQLF